MGIDGDDPEQGAASRFDHEPQNGNLLEVMHFEPLRRAIESRGVAVFEPGPDRLVIGLSSSGKDKTMVAVLSPTVHRPGFVGRAALLTLAGDCGLFARPGGG